MKIHAQNMAEKWGTLPEHGIQTAKKKKKVTQHPPLSNWLFSGISPRERGRNTKLKNYCHICVSDKLQHAYK
jgi:hypothetical protein